MRAPLRPLRLVAFLLLLIAPLQLVWGAVGYISCHGVGGHGKAPIKAMVGKSVHAHDQSVATAADLSPDADTDSGTAKFAGGEDRCVCCPFCCVSLVFDFPVPPAVSPPRLGPPLSPLPIPVGVQPDTPDRPNWPLAA